jgi:murein L,D-transpeptidase YcbB/YkuD
MKLVMPNPYSIFLHDTSSKALFQRDARALSHGCIRVDGALDFAHVLLAPGWDARAIADAVATGTTNTVELERPLPVYVTYFTAYAQGDGSISYPADIYGLDQQLLPRFGFNPATKGAGETNIDAVENCPGEPPA